MCFLLSPSIHLPVFSFPIFVLFCERSFRYSYCISCYFTKVENATRENWERGSRIKETHAHDARNKRPQNTHLHWDNDTQRYIYTYNLYLYTLFSVGSSNFQRFYSHSCSSESSVFKNKHTHRARDEPGHMFKIKDTEKRRTSSNATSIPIFKWFLFLSGRKYTPYHKL